MSEEKDIVIDMYEPQEAIPVSAVKRMPSRSPVIKSDDPNANFPDRVINDEDVKLYGIGSDLCKVGNDFELANNSPVEILNDSGDLIGYANLEVISDWLVAAGSIEYSTPERLLIETGEKVYLIPFGRYVSKDNVSNFMVDKLVLARVNSAGPDDESCLVYGLGNTGI